jgi:phage-related protein
MALRRAQLLDSGGTANGEDIASAAQFLQMELLSLANEGLTLWQKERTTLSLVASTAEYSLPAEVIDIAVDGDGFAGTIVDSDNRESRVMAIDSHQYQLTVDKTIEADRPTHVFIEKRETVRALFWPVPAQAWTFRYQKVRLIRDTDNGNVTMDVARRWLKYVWYQLAAELAGAGSKPEELVRRLRKDADVQKAIAGRSDREGAQTQLYIPRYSGGCV